MAVMVEPRKLSWVVMVPLDKDRLGKLDKGWGIGGHLLTKGKRG